jgi:hypothetical protein
MSAPKTPNGAGGGAGGVAAAAGSGDFFGASAALAAEAARASAAPAIRALAGRNDALDKGRILVIVSLPFTAGRALFRGRETKKPLSKYSRDLRESIWNSGVADCDPSLGRTTHRWLWKVVGKNQASVDRADFALFYKRDERSAGDRRAAHCREFERQGGENSR